MMIDNSAFENLKFILSQDDSDISDDNNKVMNIIKKYNIMPNTNYLINSAENNYLILINHISDLYTSQLPLDKEIVDTLQFNIEFKEFLLQEIKRRLKNLVTNNTVLLFKELHNVLNLLSLGNHYKIFETPTSYNLNEISNMFRDYEHFLKENQRNKELFDLTFHCYTLLIDTFTQLCLINSTDIQRKRTINPIIDLLTETINILKFTVSLSKNHINELNNILGKLLYYFTHILYYEVKTKTIDYMIDEVHHNFEKQADGYQLSKDTHFGNNPKEEEHEFIRFKNNCSLLILALIKRLEFHFKGAEFFSNKNFQALILSYNRKFTPLIHEKEEETLTSFKTKLLNSLVYSYKCDDTHINMSLSHKEIIQNFIIDGEHYNDNNLETIHNILLFDEYIEEYQYLSIADILLDSKVIKNDYYEFFKLNILDSILNKIIETHSKRNIEPFIKKLILYIKKNKKDSYLISSFSKLYLSLALYYSNTATKESRLKAKKFHSMFIDINGSDLLERDYKEINSLILSNLENQPFQDIKKSEKILL